ncbi:MAG: sialate O-acetylesterase [Chthoniobacterales bacterium]
MRWILESAATSRGCELFFVEFSANNQGTMARGCRLPPGSAAVSTISMISARRFLCLLPPAALFLTAGFLRAEVRTAPIFSPNMVLQRERPVPIWGTAAPGEAVTVEFAGQSVSIKAGEDGRWRVELKPLEVSKEPRTLTVRGSNTLEFPNVLVGEVWLCSGQSNMEWIVQNSAEFDREKADADQPLIRHFKVPRKHLPFPTAAIDASWVVCTPETVGQFTAAGYFFARELVRELDGPVGLINSSFGGTRIEPWLSPEAAQSAAALPDLAAQARKASSATPEGRPAYEAYLRNVETWLAAAKAAVAGGTAFPAPPEEPWITGNEQQLTRLHNAMIAPLIPYALRGALWYQGEANAGDPQYLEKMQTLVDGWRAAWGQPEMPFYLVQLAAFQNNRLNPDVADNWARLREQQIKAVNLLHFGVAVAIDIGEGENIHPTNKQDVGKRLARWALTKTYGRGGPTSGPILRSSRVENGKVFIDFDHADSGLIFALKKGLAPVQPEDGAKLAWISVAGADRKFEPAEAAIDGSRLVVWSDKVREPVAVRYACTQNPTGVLLYNQDGLPASPFRTDDW